MTNFSKIEKNLSKFILETDQKKDLKGGTCPPPPSCGGTHGKKSSYKYVFKLYQG